MHRVFTICVHIDTFRVDVTIVLSGIRGCQEHIPPLDLPAPIVVVIDSICGKGFISLPVLGAINAMGHFSGLGV